MSATDPRVPVRYVGKSRSWKDHLYGSGVGFSRGKVSQVPAWAAGKLLKHPEFEDARPASERGAAILAARPREPGEEQELHEIDSHVRLDQMTKEQMAHHAQRAFGVRIDTNGLKADIAAQVVNLTRARGG